MFSVALSLGSPPAAVSRHRVLWEPGLSSTDTFCSRAFRARFATTKIGSGRPAGWWGEISDLRSETSRGQALTAANVVPVSQALVLGRQR